MIYFQDLRISYTEELKAAAARVIDSGWYLLGQETRTFEQHYAHYIGTSQCVATGNGLDALTLIYRAYLQLGVMSEGDEVIVPANTYIASILAVTENRLRPVLVEPDPDTLEIDSSLIEAAITPKTRSILIVHLYGRCAYCQEIADLCRKYGLKLVEDNAQARGCAYQGHKTGSLGDAAGHSFYPTKNLGALGDAGAVTTDDRQLAEVIRALTNYGSTEKYVFRYKGRNSRMDELQAAMLDVKLSHLDEATTRRRAIAHMYLQGIHNPLVRLPKETAEEENAWHIFPILTPYRDQLQAYLRSLGIETMIHYPIPPHKQEAYSEWANLHLPITEQIHREELSLPIYPALTDTEASSVINAINLFKN